MNCLNICPCRARCQVNHAQEAKICHCFKHIPSKKEIKSFKLRFLDFWIQFLLAIRYQNI